MCIMNRASPSVLFTQTLCLHALKIPSSLALVGSVAEGNKRIEKRVDQMIEQGLIEEVKGLLQQGYSSKNQALQTVGYSEIISHILMRSSVLNWPLRRSKFIPRDMQKDKRLGSGNGHLFDGFILKNRPRKRY